MKLAIWGVIAMVLTGTVRAQLQSTACLTVEQAREFSDKVVKLRAQVDVEKSIAELNALRPELRLLYERFQKCQADNSDFLSALTNIGACRKEAIEYNGAATRFDSVQQTIDSKLRMLKSQVELIRMTYPWCQ